MSFSFRDKPRLSDRLRGKSGDDLLNEFKEKFDQDRKMFFDSTPSWGGSSPMTGPFSRSGFPFDDDMLPRGRQDIRSHLDDLAQRHPEFADHLRYPPWAGDIGSTRGGTWGRKRRGSGSVDDDARSSSSSEQPVPDSTTTEQSEEPGPLRGRSRNLPQYGLRNTVDLGQQQHDTAEQDKQGRGQRSMSAPPDNRAAPQRFVSRVEINPVNPADPTSGGGPTTVTSDGHGKPPVAPKQQPQPSSNVRHIPIFVEGRDEPILPKTTGPENVEQMFTSRPGAEHSFGRPPPHFATPHEFYPQQQQQARAKPAAASPQPAPKQQASPPPPPPKQQGPQPQEPPKPPANDPISRVQVVQRDVENLQSQVDNYAGSSRKDKEYVFLDEMLTRNLLKLDDIDTEGKDNVRQARKDAIRSIQRCISVLEGKVPIPDENKEVAMEANEEQSMEVTSQSEVEQATQSEAEVTSEEANPSSTEEQKMEVTPQSGEVTNQQISAVNEQVPMEVDEQKQAAGKKKKGGKKSVGKKDSKTAAAPDSSAVPVSDSKATEPQQDAS